MNVRLSIAKSELANFCQAHGILRLAIFGSALRADFGPESDIDVLVEFAPGRAPGLLGVAGWRSSCRLCSAAARWICEPRRI